MRSLEKSFAAFYEPGPNWLKGKPLRDQPLRPHVDFLLQQNKEGKLIMGGPFADGSGGMAVFLVDDIARAEEILASDPAVIDGILVASIKEWSRIV